MPRETNRQRVISRPLAYRGLTEKIYTGADLERIGQAIGLEASAISHYADCFEAAVFAFLTWGKAFEGRTPAELQRKLDGIARAAQALLRQLGIEDPAAAVDGPADRELFDVLSFTEGSNDDLVAEASGRIGRLVEVIRAVDAARVLKRIAEKAGLERAGLARLTVSPGNTGDVPLNDWIADLLSIYVKITKKKPGTSVGAPDRDNEGEAGGPLIRFLQTAGLPVNRWIKENWPDIKEDELQQMEIPSSPEALRQRIRAIRKQVDKSALTSI